MSTQIVNLNVNQQVGPTPDNLQKTGIIVTQGGTTKAANSLSLLTQSSDLAAIQNSAISVSSISWASGTVSVTTSTPHGIPTSATVEGTLSGFTPAGYNGTFAVTSTGASSFTYPLASDPGAETTLGKFALAAIGQLQAATTTFFAQGSLASVYVLELGVDTVANGVAALTTYLAAPTTPAYGYLVPREWSADSTYLTLCKNQEGMTAKVYFFTTFTATNTFGGSPSYIGFANVKSVVPFVEADSTTWTSTEFGAAAFLYRVLSQSPSAANMVPPFAFQYVVGVTALNPTPTQAALLKTNFLNYIDTGAEGGISNTLLKWGTTADGRDFSYWYSVDWMQVQAKLMLANAIINGSNNPQAPLYYNQAGINTLKAVAQGVVNSGVTFGLINGNPQVQAVPFKTYTAQNPTDYKAGIYNGLSLTFTPNRGFDQITFNITVSDFPTG